MLSSSAAAARAYSSGIDLAERVTIEVMAHEETGRSSNASVLMLRDELAWQSDADHDATERDGAAGGSADGLLPVLVQLAAFDEACRLVRAAADTGKQEAKEEAKTHAARRRTLCTKLDAPVCKCLEAQDARLQAMRLRLQRVVAALQKLDGKPLVVLAQDPTPEAEALLRAGTALQASQRFCDIPTPLPARYTLRVYGVPYRRETIARGRASSRQAV
jgi:hypothetical protein